MTRRQRLQELESALGDRVLMWFGIRGDDAAALLPLPQFRACFSVTAPLAAAKLHISDSLEQQTGRRVDLDAYDIDLDRSPAVSQFRRRILSWANQPSVLANYRPSHLMSSVQFASSTTAVCLGLFKDRQMAFEHKPWVEMELEKTGIPVLPWQYVSDDDRTVARQMLDAGPIVLRASRSSGGAGISLVRSEADLDDFWPDQDDHFVAVSPYLADAVPVNVGGCVFSPDLISLHPGSVQLIGHPACTPRVFGYCGNDFASFAQLPSETVDELDGMTRSVGRWLALAGFLGAFGVDFLVCDDGVKFCEVNARFQGSTALSVELARSVDEPDIVLDHLAALLGLQPAASRTLGYWVDSLAPAAQVIAHNIWDAPVFRASTCRALNPDLRTDLVPQPGVSVDPGGVLFRLLAPTPITDTGFDLRDEVVETIESTSAAYLGGDTASHEWS